MTDVNVTTYALTRVLFHLSEEQQGKMPRYRVHNGCFKARAMARVIVKRRLASVEQTAPVLWQKAKDAE